MDPARRTCRPPDRSLEEALWQQGFKRVAGVDEVGRGPLAGPVVAAAVVLPAAWAHQGLDDSKRLPEARRRELAALIRSEAAWALGQAEPGEVDRINVHRASLLAMARAVAALAPPADYLVVDGRFMPPGELPGQALVGADGKAACVAAASIVAKVHRDELMARWHQRYPEYNFAANKGYGTREHRQALARLGPCPLHRRSARPVAQRLLAWDGE
jgi:ribonuclease HII